MDKFKAYSAAFSARKIKFVLRPGASRLVEEEPTDLEEAVPQGGEVTFLYRSGKNHLLVIFVGEKRFDHFLVDQEDGQHLKATLEGNYASFDVDLQHAPKQISFSTQEEAPRFLTLAFRAIPGRKETLKAIAPRIKDLRNSYLLTYKNGNEKVSRCEVLLYKKQPQLWHPHTWGITPMSSLSSPREAKLSSLTSPTILSRSASSNSMKMAVYYSIAAFLIPTSIMTNKNWPSVSKNSIFLAEVFPSPRR
jgi:hypothetical protein